MTDGDFDMGSDRKTKREKKKKGIIIVLEVRELDGTSVRRIEEDGGWGIWVKDHLRTNGW